MLVAALASLCGSGGFYLAFLSSQIQPGGPACVPGQACLQSPWYLASTHMIEVWAGTALLVLGVALVAGLFYTLARRGRPEGGAGRPVS
jgi:hypothetical protein